MSYNGTENVTQWVVPALARKTLAARKPSNIPKISSSISYLVIWSSMWEKPIGAKRFCGFAVLRIIATKRRWHPTALCQAQNGILAVWSGHQWVDDVPAPKR